LTEQKLKALLVKLSGVSDFTLELLPKFSKSYWGRYFTVRKIIRLYGLDEDGNWYPDDDLIREGTHELAHHMQYHHIEGWFPVKGIMHDPQFYELHKAFLDKAFGRNVPVIYSPIVERIVASRKES
jgi:hypothetical protein